ncbi:lipopolysaccharide biosynthesis protein [Vibrio splendidus]|uniref:lipopolysaccharide biosynthesis protein n=1 Tax=Vibrio splendidus TaxID=29497 RepID=UPI0015CFD6DE|nr:polysaccharide biosynthesis protein [Vibrio splendidus]
MSSATQRYFSFALGKKDTDLLNKTFSVNLVIYLVIAIIALLLLKTVGYSVIKDYVKLPIGREISALVLYNYSVLSFILNILTAPLISVIVAHEDMKAYAYLSLAEVSMKLLVVFILPYIDYDKLELYGLLILIVAVLNFTFYLLFTCNKYDEIQFRKFYWDKNLLCEIFSFTSWTLFGQFTTVARSQAITLLINQFFNPTIVASKAIASTIAAQVNMFSSNFNTGLYPPLIKSYAEKNYTEFNSLIFTGSKLTFFLFWIFAFPLFLEVNFVFKVWLGVVPEQTVLFTRLALAEALIFSVSLPLTTAARAPGKMKLYELTLGILQISILVLSYIALKHGFEAYSIFVIAIIINIIMLLVRIFLVSFLVGLSVKDFIIKVIIPIICVVISSSVPCLILMNNLPDSFAYSLFMIVFSVFICALSIFFFGMNKEMKKMLILIVAKRFRRGNK